MEITPLIAKIIVLMHVANAERSWGLRFHRHNASGSYADVA